MTPCYSSQLSDIILLMNGEKRQKRPLTRDYLLRATYNYLERYATTEKNLRQVLDRKVKRRLPEQAMPELYEEAQGWITEIVHKAVAQNLVNDHSYAQARAASLSRSGNSTRTIMQKLQARGIAPSLASEVIEKLKSEGNDPDLLAAVKYIRRRRFGKFSLRHDGNEIMEKELASLCRAGFSYTLAREILRLSREELDDILFP